MMSGSQKVGTAHIVGIGMKNDYKVIILFNSVSDSLFNNDPINFDNNQ